MEAGALTISRSKTKQADHVTEISVQLKSDSVSEFSVQFLIGCIVWEQLRLRGKFKYTV